MQQLQHDFLLVKSPIFGGCLAPKLLTSRSPSYRPLCFTKGSLGTWHPIPCCWARRGPDSVSNKRSCDRKVVLSQEPIDQLVLFFPGGSQKQCFCSNHKIHVKSKWNPHKIHYAIYYALHVENQPNMLCRKELGPKAQKLGNLAPTHKLTRPTRKVFQTVVYPLVN